MKQSSKAIVIGEGKECKKCWKPMERRKHPINWKSKKSYYFTEWDYCQNCKHIQHYDEFKSSDWQEIERQQSFLKSI